METLKALTNYYGSYDEHNRLCSRHGQVEFLTTLHYIEKYLHPGMRILEIGAATGRYSHHLAQMGYPVDAVELVQHNIDQFIANTHPGESVTITQGNAKDLSRFSENSYDMVLLLGPMYHLFTAEEQLQALSEAVRVTRPGGFVYVAYCGNDATILQFCFLRGMLKDDHYRSLIDPATFKAHSDPIELFQLHRKEEIDDLIAQFPVTRLHYVASDGFTHYMRQALADMDEALYQQYLRYHFATCERQDMVGYSNHILDILRKETSQ